MLTLDKKMVRNLGAALLVGTFALTTAAPARGADSCQTPQRLIDLQNKADPDGKCARNHDVPANVNNRTGEDKGACEGVYKSGAEAIQDYIKKTRDGCMKVQEIQALDQCNGSSSQEDCHKKLGKLGSELAKIEKGKQEAADNLVKWIKEKKAAAQRAKEAIKKSGDKIGERAKADGQLLNKTVLSPKNEPETANVRKDKKSVPAFTMADVASGVSKEIEALKKEQDDAIKYGEETAQTLKAESQKSAAAAAQLTKMAATSKTNAGNMGPIDKDTGGGTGGSQVKTESAQQGQGSGAGGGAPSIPSIPSMGQGGGDSGASGPVAEAAPGSPTTGDLSPSSSAAQTNDATGKSSEMKLDASPEKTAAGDLTPSATGEILPGSGSSKVNTSLRDALKKKILGDAAEEGGGDALGGLPFGNEGANTAKAAVGKATASTGAGLSIPGFAGGDDAGDLGAASNEDFSMSRSETEAAVHNLLNEFGNAGGTNADRALASTSSDAEAGIEGVEGTSLNRRVHEAIMRRLKNGSVANGVNGKI